MSMTGKRRLTKSLDRLDVIKQNSPIEFPGILGAQFKGQTLVEVPNRVGFVYVRLRSNLNEIVQAYNENVSLVFGLPVMVTRDNTKNRYYIKGRDLGKYNSWGSSSYIPAHGGQHSFTDTAWGADIVWVYGRQFMPLLVTPASGTSTGGDYVNIYPYVYYLDGLWHCAGGVATPNLLPYCPTGTNGANPVLVYLDAAGAVQVLLGTNFSESYTTISLMLPYLPALPNSSCIPLAVVRLTSGTTAIGWDNIYDIRPLIDWWS